MCAASRLTTCLTWTGGSSSWWNTNTPWSLRTDGRRGASHTLPSGPLSMVNYEPVTCTAVYLKSDAALCGVKQGVRGERHCTCSSLWMYHSLSWQLVVYSHAQFRHSRGIGASSLARFHAATTRLRLEHTSTNTSARARTARGRTASGKTDPYGTDRAREAAAGRSIAGRPALTTSPVQVHIQENYSGLTLKF